MLFVRKIIKQILLGYIAESNLSIKSQELIFFAKAYFLMPVCSKNYDLLILQPYSTDSKFYQEFLSLVIMQIGQFIRRYIFLRIFQCSV